MLRDGGGSCEYTLDWRTSGVRRTREDGPRKRELVKRLSELGGGEMVRIRGAHDEILKGLRLRELNG